MEKQLKIVNALYKYKFKRTTDDLQINLVVGGSDKIDVVFYFSFESLNLRNERQIIEDLLEKTYTKRRVFGSVLLCYKS